MAKINTERQMSSTKYTSKVLSCKLTQDELLERGATLAQACIDVTTEKGHQKIEKERMKERLEDLEAERERLSTIVTDQAEERTVKIEVRMDYFRLTVEEYRTDTGEMISGRAMTEGERQMALPVVGVAG